MYVDGMFVFMYSLTGEHANKSFSLYGGTRDGNKLNQTTQLNSCLHL